MIPVTEFLTRRESLLKQMCNNSVLIVPAAKELRRSRDTEFGFRQDSDFWYLTGFPEPDAWLLLEKFESHSRSTLVCRVKDKTAEIWQGRRIGKDAAKDQFKIDQTFDLNELDDALHNAVNKKDTIYFA
jgi:Xaa-Pro aminopeptidase